LKISDVPVIVPGVGLADSVKYTLTAVLLGASSNPSVVTAGDSTTLVTLIGGTKFENG
jgi:hypothetical protein